YEILFKNTKLLERQLIKLPKVVYKDLKNGHIFNQYIIRAKRRDELRKFLKERGVGTAIYYPLPFHLQPCFRYLGYKKGDFPEAERAAEETLALPIYPELTEKMQVYIVEKIEEFYEMV
ncbi:MAG: DegT/DnrJ/EryC1/StrS family aminotransferase, partial [Deltaproteobacteria bacterium]|nr:DegT/DnrJ/EryC1/StrS family aminotransferase [Deltaproteobacteria bacterium]